MNPPTPRAIAPSVALAMVRQNTCYGGLRFALNVVTYLALLPAVVAGIFGIYTLVEEKGKGDALPMALSVIGGSVLSIAIIFLARDAARVILDIADTLIATHSRR